MSPPDQKQRKSVCKTHTPNAYTHTSTHTHAHTVRQRSRRKDTNQQKHKNPFKNMHTFDDSLCYNLNTVNLSLLQIHDYKTEQAITFWSENYQQVQVCEVIFEFLSKIIRYAMIHFSQESVQTLIFGSEFSFGSIFDFCITKQQQKN